MKFQFNKLLIINASGEYITIYQHQRKRMRERLREREEDIAKLSREKEQVQVPSYVNLDKVVFF